MLPHAFTISLILAIVPAPVTFAQATDGDVVRLPGNGAVKSRIPGERPLRYVPGGGLILSFDTDESGTVTQQEIQIGIAEAFVAADANGDGVLSGLEQQAWAAQLPTRDESLANPVRFDPNLDRYVSDMEFAQVVDSIARAYVDPITGVIAIEDLKAPDPVRPEGQVNRTELRPAPRSNF
ncbi:MAG: hypothetical protein AAF829_11785 [Pseudomonadota bacterium]